MVSKLIQNDRSDVHFQYFTDSPSASYVDHMFDREDGRIFYRSQGINSRTHSDKVNKIGRHKRPQRVNSRRGSFSYERPRRVRVPQVSHITTHTSHMSVDTKVAAQHNIKLIQSIFIFLIIAAAIGLLWFTTLQLAGDPMASLPTDLTTVSVQNGDTLSSIAGEAAPLANRSAMIARIQELNQLDGTNVYPGQLLVIPIG